jgi:vancomycin permeability regulator SanA
MLDVTVLGTQPMHLGEPVAIELQSTKSEIPPPANPPRSDPGD